MIPLEKEIATLIRSRIKEALEVSNNNKTQASKLLGLKNYQTLDNWIKKYRYGTANDKDEAKTDAPFISKLVQHYVQKAVEANVESVARLGRIIDKLETERLTHLETAIDEIKADLDNMFQLSADTVNDIVTERLDERDAERNDAKEVG